MHEFVGIATVLMILAVAGGMSDRQALACCDAAVAVGPAVFVFR